MLESILLSSKAWKNFWLRRGNAHRRVFLIFIVPTDHFNAFRTEQPYHNREGRVAKELAADIRSVKQCVLAIEDEEVRRRYRARYRAKGRR